MNWKEHAHLFANGKFKMKESKFHPDKVYEIEGYDSQFTGGCFLYLNKIEINVKYCTLIARKIEDMTDDEKLELAHITGWSGQNSWHQMVKAYGDKEEYESSYIYTDKTFSDYEESLLNHLTSKIEGFLYILSIGVLPDEFEEGFEDGTVIDAKTLEKK